MLVRELRPSMQCSMLSWKLGDPDEEHSPEPGSGRGWRVEDRGGKKKRVEEEQRPWKKRIEKEENTKPLPVPPTGGGASSGRGERGPGWAFPRVESQRWHWGGVGLG